MDTPTSNQHTYILDPESTTEMARLIHFDQVVTRAMGGPLAEQPPATIASIQRLLDLACGPGGWVLDVAYDNPHIEVEGVDISQTRHSMSPLKSLPTPSNFPRRPPTGWISTATSRSVIRWRSPCSSSFTWQHNKRWSEFISKC